MRRLLLVALAVGVMGVTASGCTLDDTYASCFDTNDCNDTRDQCFLVDIPSAGTIGNFCSRTCGSDSACEFNFGFSGACYAIAADPTFLCYQRCDFDSDCYSTSVCIEVATDTGALDYICVPDN